MLQLRELYLANNHVRTLQDLHPLRKLQRLCVLDMTGNDVCDDPNFKKFVIFHLRNLEVGLKMAVTSRKSGPLSLL